MNVYDSVKMAELMAPHGYASTEQPDDADLIVLNTCHIREKAAEKVYSEIGRLRKIRQRRREETGDDVMIAVAGCVAQAEGELMAERAPDIDIVLGPQVYHNLPEMVARRLETGGGKRSSIVETGFPVESKFDHLPTDSSTPSGVSEFLTIQEGCDKFCSFCVVPYTRGAEESRPVTSLVAEAQRMVERGAREIILLGQNVNAYHGEDEHGNAATFADLIERLSKIDGVWRIRYTTSHPREMDAALIDQHRSNPTLMPFLHLPVQSGSDRVLKAMNRGYTAENYIAIAEDLRRAVPGFVLSSDFIVGFPGETDQDFEDTMALVETVGFTQSYSFKYSRRPGTPAAGMPKQVAEDKKSERLARLQDLLNQQTRSTQKSFVGTVQPVLVERPGRHQGQLIGRTPHFLPVYFDGAENLIGAMVDVAIVEAGSNSLAGRLTSQPLEACA